MLDIGRWVEGKKTLRVTYPQTLPKVFDRWTKDGTDGPKMLDEIEKNVYVLSDYHREARDFIIEAGRIEKAASLRAVNKNGTTKRK